VHCGFRSFFTAFIEALCDKKPIGGNAQGCVMMKSTPPTPLEVSKAKLLLEILVVTLNAPAHFGNVNEMFDNRLFWQRWKPVFGWFEFANGPLDKQPFFIARRSPPIITVGGPHAQRCKTGT